MFTVTRLRHSTYLKRLFYIDTDCYQTFEDLFEDLLYYLSSINVDYYNDDDNNCKIIFEDIKKLLDSGKSLSAKYYDDESYYIFKIKPHYFNVGNYEI